MDLYELSQSIQKLNQFKCELEQSSGITVQKARRITGVETLGLEKHLKAHSTCAPISIGRMISKEYLK
ncbi:MAG: hypothetical protein CMM04_08575 [Rhodopirellula sp.]|nr:hypothetical protein [Rhodopirellula sp.]